MSKNNLYSRFCARDRCDIETLDVRINNYARIANASAAWVRVKDRLAKISALNEKLATKANESRDTKVDLIDNNYKRGFDVGYRLGCIHSYEEVLKLMGGSTVDSKTNKEKEG